MERETEIISAEVERKEQGKGERETEGLSSETQREDKRKSEGKIPTGTPWQADVRRKRGRPRKNTTVTEPWTPELIRDESIKALRDSVTDKLEKLDKLIRDDAEHKERLKDVIDQQEDLLEEMRSIYQEIK